jgi:hypothetical protein
MLAHTGEVRNLISEIAVKVIFSCGNGKIPLASVAD